MSRFDLAIAENTQHDFLTRLAIEEIESVYGDQVTIIGKKKSLHKFGRTRNADNGTKTTVAEFQDAVVNETFATTNSIDRIVSTATGDAQSIYVEGHYFDASNNLVFSSQNITLTGQTAAALDRSLCRCTRMVVNKGTFASPASEPSGDIVVYDSSLATSGLTSGKPNIDTSVKNMIKGTLGKTQTEKCATAISYVDYWIVTEVFASLNRAAANTVTADVDVEYRQLGGVWLPLGIEMQLRTDSFPSDRFRPIPYRVIPKNSDVKLVTTTNTNDTTVTGFISGFLATIVVDN